ncbi:hypothetical protein [Paenibacillus puerhi]|uniref:hypothetical protein n=1 Tax=Paenibacillus puerhi TaxID=2692622 RepID=UPI001357D5BA|nr:hypothetical protein [Paenibacillus puerhi]
MNKEMNVHAFTQAEVFDRNARLARKLLPVYLLVPILYAIVFTWAGAAMQWSAFALGAGGWVVAYLLRGPIALLAMKKPGPGKLVMISASGPLEEGVRYALLVLTSMQFGWAASLGQGWAAIEVLFAMLQTVAISSLSGRTDEKSMQAKAMLEAQGTATAHPIWGVVERISASGFHIGATLCVAAVPWMVWLLIPLHTGFNLAVVQLAKRSIVRAEAMAAIIGLAVLVIGCLVWL